MAILFLRPTLVETAGTQARYHCPGCAKISEWIERPTEPHAKAACKCGRLLEIAPKIVEARAEDGYVRYECSICGKETGFIKGGLPAYHGCDSQGAESVGGAMVATAGPCAAGMIADSELKLMAAAKKIGERTPQLTVFITSELLPRFEKMRRMVLEDDLKAAQEKT